MTTKEQFDKSDILKSIDEQFNKSRKESLMNKLKEIKKKISEHEKSIRVYNLEMEKAIKDFELGID